MIARTALYTEDHTEISVFYLGRYSTFYMDTSKQVKMIICLWRGRSSVQGNFKIGSISDLVCFINHLQSFTLDGPNTQRRRKGSSFLPGALAGAGPWQNFTTVILSYCQRLSEDISTLDRTWHTRTREVFEVYTNVLTPNCQTWLDYSGCIQPPRDRKP